jgi:hypothetical protein
MTIKEVAVKRQHINVTAHSNANIDQVWALLADVSTWTKWGRWNEAGIEKPGDGDPEGVGAIRRLRYGRRTVNRELLVAVEPPRRLSYELLSGLPIRNYHADVTLWASPDGGTDITWRSNFEGRLPGQGAFMRMFLGRFIADCAERLARAAEVAEVAPDRLRP